MPKTNEIFLQYGPDPLELFKAWFSEAEAAEPNDPEAMFLATADRNGAPSVRPVLLKSYGENGFVFHTNYGSVKGRALIENPQAELCFYWKSLRKQIRINGPAVQTSNEESDAYFKTRLRGRQIGAWASDQSQSFDSIAAMDEKIAALENEYEGKDIPRPKDWGGFRVVPFRMEFWIAHQDRLHTRFCYQRPGVTQTWNAYWLQP